ncbi:glycoprotein 3-alpha-L-fucosyltransferase A isoform X1 [Patella vulgata]|uniref:glycoprotein 3-alpha-L-fucosyltransferase A isoform X1 n=1 Tax=Patella vulgata TaxID=6465 RepID=UPI00218002DC|nr:glycoprotein 3-alpha-L-fucosyltransferase A isoform X1 [Patella vulgata]
MRTLQRRCKQILKFIGLITFLPVYVYLVYIKPADIRVKLIQEKGVLHTYINNKLQPNLDITHNFTDTKIILWHVPPRYVNDTTNLQPLKECPDKCLLTTNTVYMSVSAAVLFNAQIMKYWNPPKRHNTDQVWILHDTEPLTGSWTVDNAFRKSLWRSLFNWTMFYRSDSDIIAPYGVVSKKTLSEFYNRDLNLLVKNKTKNIAWMVSNCYVDSKRWEFVKILQKYIKVDIYGECGIFWPRNKDVEFMNMVNSTYKFYLAFESAFCEDYITEKFFYHFNSDYILVARGGANYRKYIPAGTFIDSKDFKTIKDLADHLHYLSSNHEAYMKILKRKDQYLSLYEVLPTVINNEVVFVHHQYETPAMCEVCHRVHNIQNYSKTIDRVDLWFDKKLCYSPNDLIAV